MRIVAVDGYGDASKLKVHTSSSTPTVQEHDVLIKIAYSTVNRTDAAFLAGRPRVTRLLSGWPRPQYPALGCEFSGVVDRVGSKVTKFHLGDRVFGYDDRPHGFGAHAEYKVLDEHRMMDVVPPTVDLRTAAASTEGAHYAMAFIERSGVRRHDHVFVHGATGAIGSALVQLLVAHGTRVTASAPTGYCQLVRGLGAHHVVDWQSSILDGGRRSYDFFFDAVGKSSFSVARKMLKRHGAYVSSEPGIMAQNMLLALINPVQQLVTGHHVFFPFPSTSSKVIKEISYRLRDGEFRPLIDREYSLEQVPDAFRYVGTGQKIGNVLIKISDA